VYRKTGWDTMGSVKPLHQFLLDAEFHELGLEKSAAERKIVTIVYHPKLLELLGRGWTETELCRVRTLHTRQYEVELPSGAELLKFTAWGLKRALEDAHGLQAEDQVLRFKGRMLEDAEALASRGVVSGSSILMGLVASSASAKASDESTQGLSTRMAVRGHGSLTETVAEPEPEGGQNRPAEPWWADSRTSGPQGGNLQRHVGPHPVEARQEERQVGQPQESGPHLPEAPANASLDPGSPSQHTEQDGDHTTEAKPAADVPWWATGNRLSGPRGARAGQASCAGCAHHPAKEQESCTAVSTTAAPPMAESDGRLLVSEEQAGCPNPDAEELRIRRLARFSSPTRSAKRPEHAHAPAFTEADVAQLAHCDC